MTDDQTYRAERMRRYVKESAKKSGRTPNPWPRMEPVPHAASDEERAECILAFVFQIRDRAHNSLFAGAGSAVDAALADIQRELHMLSLSLSLKPRPAAEEARQPDLAAALPLESKA